MSDSSLQPWLHDRSILVSAPAQVWSDPSGDIGSRPIDGIYFGDRRVVSACRIDLDGVAPVAVSTERLSASASSYLALARQFPAPTADPRVAVERRRSLRAGTLRERILLSNGLDEAINTTLRVTLVGADDDMQAVKGGAPSVAAAFVPQPAGHARLDSAGTIAILDAPEAELRHDRAGTELIWRVTVPAGGESTLEWTLELSGASIVTAAPGSAEWDGIHVTSGDPRLGRWLNRSLSDLAELRMAIVDEPEDEFLAAGAPWYFTLFGRDSLWAARFLLPFGTRLAEGTLKTLARRQGHAVVPQTAEQPGKILHELRALPVEAGGGKMLLPPQYYGTIDATCLWISLLAESWDWGMQEEAVERLLPALESALDWMSGYGDSDGDGFLEYEDVSGHGLANQGWKDSSDSIQWRDGRLADGPIALSEVQGYAYQAARDGARLLDRFGRPGADRWREWADRLKERFNSTYWCDDELGAYPGVALDANKRLVDSATSNMGHLLGTGILTSDGAAAVTRRLVSAEMNSGFGIRTMSDRSAGYWPLSYHGGSIWPHDTAITISGMVKEGYLREAADIAEGLVSAAEAFDYTIPELYSGTSRSEAGVPAAYPAACRPQAWSAASAVAALTALLGINPTERSGLRTTPVAHPLARDINVVPGFRVGARSFRIADSVVGEGGE